MFIITMFKLKKGFIKNTKAFGMY
ncbi:hypothetical protein SCB49_02764 [unidentified eubacterium SCB49]|nr:hypothetical protein SCB49_02764 [unidentified eubacterium SCB49]